MKILHVLYAGLGGHGNVFFSMYDADIKHEYTYQALFFGVEDVTEEYKNKAYEKNIEWDFVKKNKGIDVTSLKRLAYLINFSECDIIFLHSSMYLPAALLANRKSKLKKKIIIRETQANNLKTKSEWLSLAIAFLAKTKIVFLSTDYKEEVSKKLKWIYKEKKTVVIPNGIDLNNFCPGLKLNKENFVIGMQSRLVAIKDHPTLLKAFALIKQDASLPKNIKLKFAGEGETKIRLKELAISLGIEKDVEFTGNLNEIELVQFLQGLNLYIHASFGETMSTAIMQAMACKLPVIASDVDGINNMIENGKTGILVPLKNENLLFDAMRYLIINFTIADELSKNAYEFSKKNYSNLIMFKNYKQIFIK